MPTAYIYELWNGKEVIGSVNFGNEIQGLSAVFPTISIFKQEYNRYYETIKVPVMYREVGRTYSDTTFRKVLDVRRKSRRQITILLENYS